MKNTLFEVEFDTQLNANVYFQPMQRTLRGRFDVRRMTNAGKLYSTWPEPIPGQRLQVDISTGDAAIIEPLYDAEFAALRDRIESKGFKIGPQRESVQADVATWVYWLKALVGTGKCRITSGELPKVEGKPKLRFHSNETPDPIDKLTAAIEQQNELMAKLLAKLADK